MTAPAAPPGICLSDRIVVVPSGVYLHTGPMELREHTPEYRYALDAPVLPGRTRVFVGPAEADLSMLDRWFALQRRAGRDDLLLHLDGRDVPAASPPVDTVPTAATAVDAVPAEPSGIHLGRRDDANAAQRATHPRAVLDGPRRPAVPASGVPAVVAAARTTGAVRLSMVDGSADTVRVFADGHDARLRVTLDAAATRPRLVLDPDSGADLFAGRARTATVELPSTMDTQEAARHLTRLATRLVHENAAAHRARALVTGGRGDRLTTTARTRWQFGLSPADRAGIRDLADRLADGDLDGVVAGLRDLGALRDRTGGAARGAFVLGRLRAGGMLPDGGLNLLLRRMWDTRTDPGTGPVLDAVERATAVLLAQSPEVLRAARLVRDGDTAALELIADTDRPVTGSDLITLPVRVLDAPAWRAATADPDRAVHERDGQLWLRADASDAAVTAELSGHLARRAWQRRHPDVTAADLSAVQLVAEHESVRRTHFAVSVRARPTPHAAPGIAKRFGTARTARAARTTFTPGYADRVTLGPLDRIERRARELAATAGPALRPELATALRDLRGRVEGAYVRQPLSDKAPTLMHLIRRIGAGIPAIALTAASGTLAGRNPALIANSGANTAVFNTTQAVSDGMAAGIAGGGPPRSVLAAPKAPGRVGRYRPPRLSGPSAQLTKRAPSASTSALVSLFITGPLTGNWVLGVSALMMAAGQSIVAGAGSDWVFDRPEAVAKGRFDHYYKATPDNRRNVFVESLHYFGFELQERLRAGGVALPANDAAVLGRVRDRLLAMRPAMRTEVKSKVRELMRRRNLARRTLELFGEPTERPDVTYDLIERGVPAGAPRTWHNATRVGVQHYAMQVPGHTLAFLTGNAIDLANSMGLGAALRGLGYGGGWSLAKAIEFADAVAVAAFDALRRLDQVIALTESVLDPARPAAARDPEASTTAHPVLRKLSTRAALARNQRATNRRAAVPVDDAGTLLHRPTEMPWTHQVAYKHLPAFVGQTVGYGIAAGLGWLASGPLVPTVLGVGAVVQAFTAAGETAMRVNEPVYKQVARDRAARAEVAKLPLSNSKFVAVLDELSTLAAAANEEIRPAAARPWRPAHRRFGAWSVDVATGRAHRMRNLGRRAGHRASDLLHDTGRALTRTPNTPIEGLRLSRADRGNLAVLDEILGELATARDPRATARTDLDATRLRAELAVLLDLLGLRVEQPGSTARWGPARAELRRTHHRTDAALAEVEELRRVPLSPPETAPAGVRAAATAIRDARSGQPLRERLWAAVDHLHAARPDSATRFDVLDDGAVLRVTTAAGDFTVAVRETDNERATLTLPTDDLSHAAFGRQRKGTALDVPAAVAASPARLAGALRAAAADLVAHRGSKRERVRRLWRSTVDSLTSTVDTAPVPLSVPLPATAGPDPHPPLPGRIPVPAGGDALPVALILSAPALVREALMRGRSRAHVAAVDRAFAALRDPGMPARLLRHTLTAPERGALHALVGFLRAAAADAVDAGVIAETATATAPAVGGTGTGGWTHAGANGGPRRRFADRVRRHGYGGDADPLPFARALAHVVGPIAVLGENGGHEVLRAVESTAPPRVSVFRTAGGWHATGAAPAGTPALSVRLARPDLPADDAITRAVVAAFDHLVAGRRTAADAALRAVARVLNEPDVKAAWLHHVVDLTDGEPDTAMRNRLEVLSELIAHCRY
ncbi:hypothetical protein Val02_45220 [Virgisporangium aliadipatigenens]|uniref:Uncharacterized protein n=1 Tax=Virgisporangium aliadipatigenens TaxID=741659 RepID=A0A8J4DRZ8_9ACTN|nr:hypothetical protein [Virgisporangium aliadipatigenens]GIJ47636.1 hypothetical protein Val02_45220 [Virgisporangium aliadipatigenens]